MLFRKKKGWNLAKYYGVWKVIIFISMIPFSAGTTAINGAPPTMLSPTMTTFPVPQTNGQTAEIYPNGLPQYPGKYPYPIIINR